MLEQVSKEKTKREQIYSPRWRYLHGGKTSFAKWLYQGHHLPTQFEWLDVESEYQTEKWIHTNWVEGQKVYSLTQHPSASQNHALEKTIKASRSLLTLGPDWDGEGSVGYSEDTWNRMERFLIAYSSYLKERYSTDLPVPEILPGPDGSIDILWKSTKYELLLNIPPTAESPARFYGDDRGNLSIKGKLDPSKYNQGLLEWLVTHQNP